MKKHKIVKFLKVLLAIFMVIYLVSLDMDVFSQPGMPPGHGQNGDQSAGGFAPIGEGLLIFLASAIAYGVRRYWKGIKKKD